ncbi:NitT/TauT family transport system permease protein [Rhizobium sp. NFR07]|uniref:ABC transporter permease n=1 Tax=Rhizobium sp. NFR07 TaxID=1566262 RepID=UPI0008F03925|nr:ABC transporter permease [Rhizobium sp. NFR07]SFB30858.1 NitT/TauT family transport system permease protein [Rhizobium sp. NFR07]
MSKNNAAWFATPLVLIALIAIWHAYVTIFSVSPFILPSPLAVGKAIVKLLSDPRTWQHTLITLYEIVAGFIIAVIIGIVFGGLLGKIRWLEQTLNPLIVGLQVMPKVALIPLFIVWFGFGVTSKIVLAAVISFFPIMTNTILGIKSVETGHRDVMLALNASRWQTFRDVELPSALPFILTGMEVGIVLATIGAIVGEYLGGSQGLGYLAVSTLNAFDVQSMFGVIFILTALGLILYFLVVMMRRYLTPWHAAAKND